MIKQRGIIALICSIFSTMVFANEGMWLLNMVKQQNLSEMQTMGLKLSAEDIYSLNQSCLKDAVVWFANGCTGEMVSKEGLILTNHHCGFATIQSHSSVEKDYLKDGFWAMQRAEEIPSPGLSVVFIRQIKDVTDRVIPENINALNQQERQKTIDSLIQKVSKEIRDSLKMEPLVKAFYSGNQYIMFVTQKYNDVRFVGAPPSAIGKFGGDTDNWMWPRHTADFSMFRIYAKPNGEPANFSQKNVPYTSNFALPISTKGYLPGDFAMTIGFPGSTDRYLTSWGVSERMNSINEARIVVRNEKQNVWMKHMQQSDKIRIQYASKYYSSSNYYKNSIGMNRGLVNLDVIARKQSIENNFNSWANADTNNTKKYGKTLTMLAQNYTKRTPITKNIQFLNEAFLNGTEIFSFAANASTLKHALEKNDTANIKKAVRSLKNSAISFYKNYDAETDKEVLIAMIKVIANEIDAQFHPDFYATINRKNGSTEKYAEQLFKKSIFADQNRLFKFLEKPTLKKLKSDPAYIGYQQVWNVMSKLYVKNDTLSTNILIGKRLFEAGLQKMESQKVFYPDANSTMRLSFGTVGGYIPRDGVSYNYFTTLNGVMEKEDPTNDEFTVPEKLKQLYHEKDFGIYADADGLMHTCFVTNNDITGGNSGSPVINKNGELIGIAFDGNMEALSGDIIYENELKKCINVDIRYVLFLIDKFAGAHHLLEEMDLR